MHREGQQVTPWSRKGWKSVYGAESPHCRQEVPLRSELAEKLYEKHSWTLPLMLDFALYIFHYLERLIGIQYNSICSKTLNSPMYDCFSIRASCVLIFEDYLSFHYVIIICLRVSFLCQKECFASFTGLTPGQVVIEEVKAKSCTHVQARVLQWNV